MSVQRGSTSIPREKGQPKGSSSIFAGGILAPATQSLTYLRSFSHFQIFHFLNLILGPVKDSQNDQIRMQTWFTSAFSMNGTELRSFSHFQILKWIVYSDLSRILENWLILKFAFIHWKTVKNMIKFEC